MRKIFFLIMTILYITGCHKEEKKELNRLSIKLITNDNPAFFTRTVILFENSDYLIKTNLDTYLNAYPFDNLYGYDKIKDQVIQDSNHQNVLFMTDYLYHPKDSAYILAYHLEKGSCLIFDKKEHKIIPTIQMEKWDDPAPLAGAGGRRFFIKNELFLETMDWIS